MLSDVGLTELRWRYRRAFNTKKRIRFPLKMDGGPKKSGRFEAELGTKVHRLARALVDVRHSIAVGILSVLTLDEEAHLAGIVATHSLNDRLGPTGVSWPVLNHLRPGIHL